MTWRRLGGSLLKSRVRLPTSRDGANEGGDVVEAGQGAREQAARAAREVAEARRRLEAAERRERNWAAGAAGEQLTAQVLTSLTTSGWLVLHDLHWPGRPFANIDHIAIGPGGVVVIDSKNWSGRIDVREGVLRQNGYRRFDECEAAATAAAAVAVWLEPQHRSLVVAMLCLVGQPTPVSQPTSAAVHGLEDLNAVLLAMPTRLSSTEIGAIAGHLRTLLSGDRSPAMATTGDLAKVGPAPRARALRRTSSAQPSRRRSVKAHKRRPRPGRRSVGQSLLRGLTKAAFAVFLLLVVVPHMLGVITHRMVESITPAPPAEVTATPTATPTPTPKR